MNTPVVKVLLLIVTVGIWINMLRISIPAILSYIEEKRVEVSHSTKEASRYLTSWESSSQNFTSQEAEQTIAVRRLRNPFVLEENVDKKNNKKSYGVYTEVYKSQPEIVSSSFRFKGVIISGGNKTAILEGRPELGAYGIFYANKGETVMDEKILEIFDNSIIIEKKGKKIRLFIEE